MVLEEKQPCSCIPKWTRQIRTYTRKSQNLPCCSSEEDALHCLACKVTTTSEEQLAIHKEGKRHRRHLAMAELQGSPLATADQLESSGGSQDLHCDLCQVTAPTPQHREYHLRHVSDHEQ